MPMSDLDRDTVLQRVLINQAAMMDALILIGARMGLRTTEVLALETAFLKTTELVQEIAQ